MSADGSGLPRRRAIGLGVGVIAASAAACAPGPDAAPGRTPTVPATPAPSAGPSSSSRPTAAPPSTMPPAAAAPAQPPPGAPAVEVMRGNGNRPEVALTFHGAGPLDHTRRLLAVLAEHRARVTVLAVGTWLSANPEAARLVLDGGHELGNHTWSHPNLSAYAPGPMFTEIARCRDELIRLTGGPGAFFRQSAGRRPTPEQLVQAGKAGYRRVLSYDVDSTDWQHASPAAIRAAVATATAGSVISLHCGRPNTIDALPAVLSDLSHRGLTAVTSTDLLR